MGRISKATYADLLDKVRNRLAGWKANQLSMAGRAVLIQSSSSPIPLYQMQTAKIPESVCHEIDKDHKIFLWGHTETNKKLHLVSWEAVCKPKSMGGLGLKKMGDVNEVMLAKLGWRLQKAFNKWSKVLSSKYLRNSSIQESKVKSNASQIWRSIQKGKKLLLLGQRWRVGNGLLIHFWTDHWLDGGPLVQREGLILPSEDHLQQKVSDYIDGGNWSVSALNSMLPSDIVDPILSIPIGIGDNCQDCVIWDDSSTGIFSAKSAYET